MKKITLFFSLLAMMIVGLQARAASVYDVYVETDNPTFNVYNWEPKSFGEWPGKLITEIATQTEVNGKDYYKFSVEGGFVIFNKGDEKTQDIPLQEGDNFFTYPINGDFTQYETTNQPIQITSYTVAGAAALMGVEWDPAATQNDMTLQDDGTYKLVKEGVQLAAGGYDYKVVGNHAWSIWSVPVGSGNQTLTIAEDGKYNVTFTLTLGDENVLTANAEKVEDVVIEHNYTVTGVATLMGSDWNTNDEANLMALQEDGTYKLVKEGVQLAAGGYDYKVVRDHSWDWSIPQGNVNQTLTIAEDGKYNVTFTLTLGEQNVLTAEAVKVGDVVIEHNYTVAGVAALMGSDWNTNDEANLMALQEDGTYKLVKEGVQLAAGGYDYKVVRDHSWDWSIPQGNVNQTLTIAEDGKYNVTFTLTLGEQNVLTAEAVKVEEPLQYLLHYGHDGENDWQNATFVVGEGTYEGKLVAKDVEFTAVKTQFGVKYGDIWYAGLPNAGEGLYWIHDTWCTSIPLSTGDGVKNFIINEIGTYTFVLTVGENGITMDVEGFPVAPVLGDLNGDGKADVTDVNIIVNMILGKQAKTEAGNLNGDDDVDVTDVNLLVNIILGKSGDTTGEGE